MHGWVCAIPIYHGYESVFFRSSPCPGRPHSRKLAKPLRSALGGFLTTLAAEFCRGAVEPLNDLINTSDRLSYNLLPLLGISRRYGTRQRNSDCGKFFLGLLRGIHAPTLKD